MRIAFKLFTKLKLRCVVEPSTVKVRIKISVSTDSGNVAFEVCRESTFQNESGEKWKNREDAMQDVKNTAIPLAYEDMQRVDIKDTAHQ